MEKTVLTSDGLKNALKKFTIEESIAEYVWNGFDANADIIKINEVQNELSGTLEITIEDDGDGIPRGELDKKFRPVFQSEKQIRELFKDSVLLKGKKGVGRLSFFNVASKAIWETVYKKEDGRNFFYTIEVGENDLTGYNPSVEIETEKPIGTKVKLLLNENIDILKILAYLKTEYAWFLKVYESKHIYVNNKLLDCSEFLAQEEHKEGTLSDQVTTYNIDIYVWTNKLNREYSKYYFLDSSGKIK
ncbi:MAG: ATP-binding protein, partial [Clostridia bacterium]|nr:ATP-binding protein [Clostridia bacterium]